MLKNVFIFVAGAFAGTVVGARLVKKRYEEIANEEIEEIRAYYKEKEEKQEEPKAVDVPEEIDAVEEAREYYSQRNKEEIVQEKIHYDKIANSYAQHDIPEEQPAQNQYSDPYVIDPSEFGNEGHYGTETFTYFADGVLVDPDDEVVEDWEDIVGRHHVDIFNEFPDATSVYIRNDFDGIDYEILKDDWCWSDFEEPEKKPHQL